MRVLFIYLVFIFLSVVGMAQVKEFRGVWIATVDNIDWPSKGNWGVDSQKNEFIKILNEHQRNGINAVIVQVRPATDAFYPSQYEPWSQFLTGKQGTPPNPYYDPLEFMITEAHKRGMEFHAWFNPYRAVFNYRQTKVSPSHITKLYPQWFVTYAKHKYFDPGNRDAQEYLTNVVRDVVEKYEVDAIHFDDYFYPYKEGKLQFPDNKSYSKYGKGMSKADWRRSNTDSIIKKISVAIKEIKPHVKFGISPFGIWRNLKQDSINGSATNGSSNYDDLYADILLWLEKGWIDYVAPQLYWEFEHPRAPYQVLLDWWNEHTYGKHLYIGLGAHNVGSRNIYWQNQAQLLDQIDALREKDNVKGMIFFSSKSLLNNPLGVTTKIRNEKFKTKAIIPTMDFIKPAPTKKP